jgi:hypothetical protein
VKENKTKTPAIVMFTSSERLTIVANLSAPVVAVSSYALRRVEVFN